MHKAVLIAAEKIMTFYESKDLVVEEKSPNNPVTEADFAANSILVKHIRQNFPDDAILSEESNEEFSLTEKSRLLQTQPRVWILDPIDGTRQFIKGTGQFSISVGLVEEGVPVLGFICNPAHGFFLSGGKETGLLSKGKPYQPPTDKPGISVCISNTEKKQNLFSKLESEIFIPENAIIGSVAYKMGLVAYGKFNLILSKKPKNEWDIAGGMALFSARNYSLLDQDFQEIILNKKDTRSYGLIGGSLDAISWYKEFLTRKK